MLSHPSAVLDMSDPRKPHQQIEGQTLVFCQSHVGEMIFQCGLNLISLIKNEVV